jgi:hypothetical protein
MTAIFTDLFCLFILYTLAADSRFLLKCIAFTVTDPAFPHSFTSLFRDDAMTVHGIKNSNDAQKLRTCVGLAAVRDVYGLGHLGQPDGHGLGQLDQGCVPGPGAY